MECTHHECVDEKEHKYEDHKCVETLKKVGFTLAFTTEYSRVRPGQKQYELGRIRMSKGDSLKTFIQRVS